MRDLYLQAQAVERFPETIAKSPLGEALSKVVKCATRAAERTLDGQGSEVGRFLATLGIGGRRS